jgi:hypothetical protein
MMRIEAGRGLGMVLNLRLLRLGFWKRRTRYLGLDFWRRLAGRVGFGYMHYPLLRLELSWTLNHSGSLLHCGSVRLSVSLTPVAVVG